MAVVEYKHRRNYLTAVRNTARLMKGLKNMVLFVEYPKCSTCMRAKKWLIEHQIEFEDRHIAENNPSASELKAWYEKSGLPLKKFFNTSGRLYKELNLKEKLPGMSDQEMIELLATDGMLVKRPVIVGDDFVLVGFKEEQWSKAMEAF